MTEHSSMTWHGATFDGMPSLGILNACRKALGPDGLLCFQRRAEGTVTIYLPPTAAAPKFLRAAAASPDLPPFRPCPTPNARDVRVLFGEEEDLKTYLG